LGGLAGDELAYLTAFKSHGWPLASKGLAMTRAGSCRTGEYGTIGDDRLANVSRGSCLGVDSDVFLVSASSAATEKLNR
jgi:hypothetical protein